MAYPRAVVTAPPTAAAPSPAPRHRLSLRELLRSPEGLAAALAILIGLASLLSAALAWRASLASIDSSLYQSLSVQQQARVEQIERQLEGIVGQDERFVGAYQEDAVVAHQLAVQADQLRSSDPATADQLDLEAQARLALARSVEPFFQGANVSVADDGTVAYDHAYVLRNLESINVELRELRTENSGELADRADNRSLNLIGVAALIVAALFLLTIAEVSHGRVRLRQAFLVAGAVMVVTGTVAFALVEVLA